MATRNLARTVVVVDPETERTRAVYYAGTPEQAIPEEDRALITNPKAWGPTHEERKVLRDFESNPAPAALEDCTVEQLQYIAEVEQVPLGNARKRESMIQILRAAGVGQ